MKNIKLLLVGAVPPPFHGASYAIKLLCDSLLSSDLQFRHIDTRFVTDIKDTEKFTPAKALLLCKYLVVLAWFLLCDRPRYAILCPAFNRNAFIKDSVFIIVTARLFRVRTLLWCHGNGLKTLYDQSSKPFRRYIAYTIQSACRIVPVARAMEFNFTDLVDAGAIRTIHNGIPDECLARNKPVNARPLVVTYLSNMVKTKGWKVLLEAAVIICGRHDDVEFHFYGKPSLDTTGDELTQAFSATGYSVRIVYHGPIYGQDKEQWLANSDIFCFPTFYEYETFGIVLLEAMKCGIPIVTTHHAGIPEIVDDEHGGLIVEKNNAGDLILKLERLIAQPYLRQRMSVYNRDKFVNQFTIERHAAHWIELIRELEGKPDKRAG